MRFNERFKLARAHAKLTQQAIAGRFKIERAAVSQWEKGATTPTPERLLALPEILGVNLRWLLEGEGEMQPEPTGLSPRARAEFIAAVRGVLEMVEFSTEEAEALADIALEAFQEPLIGIEARHLSESRRALAQAATRRFFAVKSSKTVPTSVKASKF